MTAIFIEDSFDSAHWLPNVPDDHKCHGMHGHTYRVRIEAIGEMDDALGWVVDYSEIKCAWTGIFVKLDHKVLNNVLPNPTCELLAEHIRLKMELEFPKLLFTVELRETLNCGAISFRSAVTCPIFSAVFSSFRRLSSRLY